LQIGMTSAARQTTITSSALEIRGRRVGAASAAGVSGSAMRTRLRGLPGHSLSAIRLILNRLDGRPTMTARPM
jgi:hypothetical protein